MAPSPNPVAPGEPEDEASGLDEDSHPATPHPDEPLPEGPGGTVAGDAPDELSDIGEPHPDEPGAKRPGNDPAGPG